MRMSFKYKFILSFVTIEIIFISLIVFFNFSSLHKLANSLIEEKIETAGKLFMEFIETPLVVYDLATIDNALESFTHLKNVAAVKILNKEGRVISHLYDDKLIYKDIFEKKLKESNIDGRTFRLSVVSVELDGYTLGHVEILFEITESLETIKSNRTLTFFLVITEILLSISVAYIIGYRLTLALHDLTLSAEKIAKDDQADLPHIRSNSDEITVLAYTLQTMQQKIAERNNLLQTLLKKVQDSSDLLKKKRDFYTTILNNANTFILVLNINGEIVLTNKTVETLTGYTHEELLDKVPWKTFVLKDMQEHVEKVFSNLITDATSSSHEDIWIKKDGSTIPLAWSNAAILNEKKGIEYLIFVGADMTQRKIEQTMRALLNSPTDSIILISNDETIIEINEMAAKRFHSSVNALKGKNIFQCCSETILLFNRSNIDEVISTKKPLKLEASYNNNTYINHLYPILDQNAKVVQISVFTQDITNERENQKALEKYIQLVEELSITDTLTKLYNRRYYHDVFYKELNRAKREENIFALLSLDVDNFKLYNDTYGHQMGNNVLYSIAQNLKEGMRRSTDVAFRMGGEEFCVIYIVDKEENVYDMAEAIRLKIENRKIEHRFNNGFAYVTASVGVVYVDFQTNPKVDIDQELLYKVSDEMLYKAKNEGRNRVEVRKYDI